MLSRAETVRNILFAVLGCVGLVMKPKYHGPLEVWIYSYWGNFIVSFALYFAALSGTTRLGLGRFSAAASTLLAVEVFEVTDGLGVMSNVYDPVDLAANAAGVLFALVMDHATTRLISHGKTK